MAMRNREHPNEWQVRASLRCHLDLGKCRPEQVIQINGYNILVSLGQRGLSVRLRSLQGEVHRFACQISGIHIEDEESTDDGEVSFQVRSNDGMYDIGIDIR